MSSYKSRTILFIFLIFLQLLFSTELNLKSFEIFKPNHIPFIEGHRGVNKEYPENTLRAFQNALDNEIDGVELDVWLSKDNIPVVVHGSLFGFLYFYYKKAFGFVRNYLLDELKKLEVRNGDDKMPTLEEVFKLSQGKLFINIELKDSRCDKLFPVLIELIKKYDMFEKISLSSFHHQYAKYVFEYNKNNNKKIEFGFLYRKKLIFDLFKYDMKNTTLNVYYTDATKARCDKAHENGMAVIAWFRMNDKENDDIYKKLLDNGVDGIISNFPKQAKAYRDFYLSNFNKNNSMIEEFDEENTMYQNNHEDIL